MQHFETIAAETTNYVCTLWLSRPERRNAINRKMADELSVFLSLAENDPLIRVLVIRGKGDCFCAGGDLSWMSQDLPESDRPGMVLASLFSKLYSFSKPIVVIVHGAAMGGAFGLLATADFVLAEESTRFSFSEVKLGLAPATISPFVVKRIGQYRASQLMTTGMAFDPREAVRYGLIDFAGVPDEIESYAKTITKQITLNAPEAVRTTKRIIRKVADKEVDSGIIRYTAEMLNSIQQSGEAKEGMRAFLEKRDPVWPNQS